MVELREHAAKRSGTTLSGSLWRNHAGCPVWLVHGEGMSLVHKKQELRQYVPELAKADELNPA